MAQAGVPSERPPPPLHRTRRRRTTSDAVAMHESVTWLVWSQAEAFWHLQQQLILAIQDGRLQSLLSANSDSEDSEESIDDDHFGPSIYAVNEQYIKPVTAEAGKMSWALMRNPKGLDCHVFVSHAWQEGIFEFLSKVLASWPSGARNAWCCMLANPQHLNIGCMLQSPKSSPFALALQASRDVLVVPNRHRALGVVGRIGVFPLFDLFEGSVYCRLWCGYEAFVASEDRKVIQVAARPAWRDRRGGHGQAYVGQALDFASGQQRHRAGRFHEPLEWSEEF
ncbi:Uncharacterized protein SCF082_LOCUS1719 [Durusdinium trenchii]|uniref:Uncharacterized protein n=1 Tax=Durusdinium trenchii TaxID=1381693 RepID=A0ABP0HJ93_9DINO